MGDSLVVEELSVVHIARGRGFCYIVDDNRQIMQTLNQMLTALDIPDAGRRAYVDLLTHGESPARTLAQRLGVPRSSIYDHLRPLLSLRLVVEKEKDGKAVFGIHDIDDVGRLVNARVESLLILGRTFEREKKTFEKQSDAVEPKIKFVEGKEGLISLLHEMLWGADTLIETVWPYSEMLKVLGKDVLETFNTKRIRQKIELHTIWTDTKVSRQHIWKGGDMNVERKIAPAKFHAPMGYSIYGNKVSFISSHKELYGFVVHSADFAALMRMQFKALWGVSK
jgi:sugar-specific transcriptional regulator TrmB